MLSFFRVKMCRTCLLYLSQCILNSFFSFFFLALYSLEEDWTDLVEGAAQLPERVRSQQTAIWELVETEVAYIRTLKVIQDVSQPHSASCVMMSKIAAEQKCSQNDRHLFFALLFPRNIKLQR